MSDMRNWAVERLAEQLRYPCKNASAGCAATFLLTKKAEHESACPYRTYTCLFRTCSWTGLHSELMPHLRSSHAARFLDGSRQRIDIELNSPTFFCTDWAVCCHGHVFRVNVFQNIPNSMLYSSIYLIGTLSGARAEEFNYTITIHGPDQRRIAYTRHVHSEATKMSSLCTSGDCFQVNGDVVKYFARDNKLRLHLDLQRWSIESPSSP